jgi:hypothetical protein
MCRGCAFGKNSKDSFPSSESRSKRILDISYVCGLRSVTEDEEQEASKGEQPKDEQSSQTSNVEIQPS